MWLKHYKWIMEPGTAYEIRREMRVREPKQTAIAWGRKYQNIDTGKFDSDKIPTLFSQSLGEIMSDNLCGAGHDFDGDYTWPECYASMKPPRKEFDFDEEFRREDEELKRKAKKEAERQAQIAEDEKNRERRRQLRLEEQKAREARRLQREKDEAIRIERARIEFEKARLDREMAEIEYQRRVREREHELAMERARVEMQADEMRIRESWDRHRVRHGGTVIITSRWVVKNGR